LTNTEQCDHFFQYCNQEILSISDKPCLKPKEVYHSYITDLHNEEWTLDTQLVLSCLGEAETGIVQQVIYHSAISLVIQQ